MVNAGQVSKVFHHIENSPSMFSTSMTCFQICLEVPSEKLCLPNLISLRSRSPTLRKLSGSLPFYLFDRESDIVYISLLQPV